MKFRSFYIIAAGILLWVSSLNFLNGPAQIAQLDRTGSPLSGGASCNQCHNDQAIDVELDMKMFDDGVSVDCYEPGKTYRFVVDFKLNSGNSSGYGLQAISLDAFKESNGTFENLPPNTQLTELSGQTFFEHGKLVSRLPFEMNWIAPVGLPADSARVIIYAGGVAANGDRSNQGDGTTSAELKLDLLGGPNNRNCVSGTNEPVSKISGVRLLSNPVDDFLKIKMNINETADLQLRLANLSGQQLVEKRISLPIGAHLVDMEIGALNTGIYFLQISDGRKVITEKVMKF